MKVLHKTMTDLRFVRVFIVHNWFSLWVSTYTGFEVSLHGLVSKTEKDEGQEIVRRPFGSLISTFQIKNEHDIVN